MEINIAATIFCLFVAGCAYLKKHYWVFALELALGLMNLVLVYYRATGRLH